MILQDSSEDQSIQISKDKASASFVLDKNASYISF